MTMRGLIARFTQQEDLNFLLTNRIPRAALRGRGRAFRVRGSGDTGLMNLSEIVAAVRDGLVKAGAIVKPLRDWLGR